MRSRCGLALLALSCSSNGPTTSPASSALPPGVVARSGAELVSASTIARIAERGVSPRAASELAVVDAVLAAGAREQLSPGAVRSIERAALARALLESLARDVKALPQPTDAELQEIRSERWLDLDRPDAVRTTHAVVLNDKPERAAEARLVAEKLGAALAAATTGAELIRIAQAFPGEGFEIHAEPLPFVTADGRSFARTETGLAPRGGFDQAFASAANAIPGVGQLGPIATSSFGFHLILVEERMPGVTTPREGLAALLAPEVQARRGSKMRRELLEKLRAGAPIQVERAVDDLTARVKLSP
ncbi:MAG: hypothetical protein EOO73_36610 [Myxococcales bacterium]|nr:MAG: hypothetical protein EOO73_36610 [Myxococcales bacterium]